MVSSAFSAEEEDADPDGDQHLALIILAVNALFVVKFEADNKAAAKKSLIRKSPLKAKDIFASVNDYYWGFDASNPFASSVFTHLVTVYIKSGDPETFQYLKFVVKPMGKLIRGNLEPGVASHRISALVESNKRTLPPDSSIRLESGIAIIPFEYTGRHLRCMRCFSYRHFEARCNLRGTYVARLHKAAPPPATALVAPPTAPPADLLVAPATAPPGAPPVAPPAVPPVLPTTSSHSHRNSRHRQSARQNRTNNANNHINRAELAASQATQVSPLPPNPASTPSADHRAIPQRNTLEVIPTIPIATTQRSSVFINPRRPPKKTWHRCSRGTPKATTEEETRAEISASPLAVEETPPANQLLASPSAPGCSAERDQSEEHFNPSNVTIRKCNQRADSSETKIDPQNEYSTLDGSTPTRANPGDVASRREGRHHTPLGKILDVCLRKAKKIVRCRGKRKALERRLRENILRDNFSRAQLGLEADPQSAEAQVQFQKTADSLQDFEREKARWVDETLQAWWISDGDKCSKIFFKTFKGLSMNTEIHQMYDGAGLVQKGWENIAGAANDFFINILDSSQGISEFHFERVLVEQKSRISDADRQLMEDPLTLVELFSAAKELAKNKAPGPDGVPMEFFVLNWPTVGAAVHKALLKGIVEGRLHISFTKGLIVLLCKKGDQMFFNNKRPITMFNVIYKIGAKAYQLRLVNVLCKFISPQQAAFLPGRNIHHALLYMSELLQQAENSNLDYLFLKLDITKAFDLLEWNFILALLEKIGFGSNFIAFIRASQDSARSAILINGHMTGEFIIRRSVC
ncbi:unnamed protein product [Calypogeia fissa]